MFIMSKDEMKKYQANDRFGKAIQSDLDFTLHYFLTWGDKV